VRTRRRRRRRRRKKFSCNNFPCLLKPVALLFEMLIKPLQHLLWILYLKSPRMGGFNIHTHTTGSTSEFRRRGGIP